MCHLVLDWGESTGDTKEVCVLARADTCAARRLAFGSMLRRLAVSGGRGAAARRAAALGKPRHRHALRCYHSTACQLFLRARVHSSLGVGRLSPQDYTSGALLTGHLKKELIALLQRLVRTHREARQCVTNEMVLEFMTPRRLKFSY